ncbi:TPA: hypothetical protein ACNHAG_002485 [Klebsiella pneumoniae]|uniref:hypothetical protein n=1 Tax=Klebsiella pneumoniae TaxID=573 RepID=UPI001CC21DB7|nr:hypothetical protein [Klebsiella pneumoniae]MCZ0917232.1 hypothetical protein [Klebsiella pneumoniae subsp. pneumoniae]MDK3004794.1 hypothetical protein [Klebsiella pneumoniae]WAN45834.1 hypothetical protein N7T97_09010 [Klebsiella pneumoniae]
MTKSTITRERIARIANPDAWVKCTHEEVQELARMALAAMDSEPVKRVNADQMHHVCLEANRHLDKYGAMAKEVNKLLGRIPAHPAPVVPVTDAMAYAFHHALTDSPLGDDDVEDIKAGLRAALVNVFNTQPAPQEVHDEK